MSNFNDVENNTLRTYNRAQFAMNLAEDTSPDNVRDYFQQFNEQDRTAILIMLAAIRQNPEETKRQVLVNANID